MNAIRMRLKFDPSEEVVFNEDIIEFLANPIFCQDYLNIYHGLKDMVDQSIIINSVHEAMIILDTGHSLLYETWFCPLQENVAVFEQSAGFLALKEVLKTNGVEVSVEIIPDFDFDNVHNDSIDTNKYYLLTLIEPDYVMWESPHLRPHQNQIEVDNK